MRVRVILLTILFLFLLNCSHSKLVTYEKNPTCQSTVEGVYHAGESFKGRVPVIIMQDGVDTQLHNGTILKITADSILFDVEKEGPFYDPPAKMYPLSEIITVVDSNGTVVYGHIPKKYAKRYNTELYIVRQDDPDQKVRKMMLYADQPFSYCLSPGIYQIEQILFYDPVGNIDRAADSLDFEFVIDPKTANYIGDFYLDIPGKEGKSFNLPYVIQQRPNSAAVAGALGGAIGGVLVAASNAAKGVIGTHALRVANRADFMPAAALGKNTNLLHLKSQIWGK